MKNRIAILLPYKENYNINKAGAASIWVKDYLKLSRLNNQTIVYGNLDKKFKPLTKNFRNLDISSTVLSKNIFYTNQLYRQYLKNKFSIIEIHNRPESLVYMLKKKSIVQTYFCFS